MAPPTSWWVLDFRVLLVVFCCSVSGNVPLRPKDMVSLLEEGKRQYNLIQTRTSMPSFGSCWKNAVSFLHSGCQRLDDRLQSEVALNFANCFLEGAGLPRHECESSAKSGLQHEGCLKTMTDKTFIAYTEFFTHTQNMCFFIMSQVWHEETEKTIDKLSTSAADVARQLEASEELQEELLSHQRQSVLIQQELLENGVSLGGMLHESRDSLNLIISEFRSSTLEQQRLLSMVFHHLSTLQSWIVGEVSWVDSIAFYVPSFAFVYFLTSAQRTASARIPGLLVLLLAGLVERFISYVLLNDGADASSFQPVDVINEYLSWWVWLVRRSAIACNTVLLVVILYRYRNREEVMHQLLEHIRRQNEELLKHIHGKVTSNGVGNLTKSGNSDEADGFGYMPVMNSSSSSMSTPRLKESPVPLQILPVVRIVPPINGVRSTVGDIDVTIPTAHSAFKPIRESSPMEPVEVSSASGALKKQPSSSDVKVFSSRATRKRTPVPAESPVRTRYNTRRSKTSAVSPV